MLHVMLILISVFLAFVGWALVDFLILWALSRPRRRRPGYGTLVSLRPRP